jgi:Tfp pilus assembly protein PilX
MPKTKRKNTIFKIRNHEEGVALIAAILTLLLISAITAGIIILTNTETNTSANFKDEQRAFFSAKAGIEEVRDRLRTAATNSLNASLPITLPGGANSVLYITNALNGETVTAVGSGATYPDDEICKETSSVSCSGGFPSAGTWYTASNTASNTYQASPVLDWKWVRVQLKQSNGFGTNYAVNGDNTKAYFTCLKDGSPYEVAFSTFCASPTYLPVYVLTSLAVTPSGSRRMVQVEVGQDTIQFVAPAALTMDGALPSFSGGNSAQFGVSGIDVGGCGSASIGPPVPAVGVTTAADVATVSSNADIPNKTQNNYTGSGGTTPDVENVSSGLAGNLTSPTNLQDLASTLKADVTQPVINGPASGLSTPGTVAAPQIVYVNGDLSMSGNTTGYGILIVTGTLTLSGTVQWNGLVLVVGKGNFQMDGTNSVNGAVLVANTLGTGGSILSVLGPPGYGVNGGGGAKGGLNYSASCLTSATKLTTYHVISMRELMN